MSDVSKTILDANRLASLHATNLLATPREESFDRVTRLAAKLLDVPVALISLVDSDHQFFKSCVGLPEPWASERRTPLSHSFCQHVVTSEKLLAVQDARIDPLLCDNLAIRDLGVVAYLGAPLQTPDGHIVGSLCAIDSQPRQWTTEQKSTLTDLAAFVATEIDARRSGLAAARAEELLRAANVESALETRVRFLADSMPQIVWTARADGNINYYNQRWFEYTGLTLKQTQDWGWKEVVHPDDLELCVSRWTHSLQAGDVHVGEYRLKRGMDGEYRWHLCRCLPCRDDAGEITEWVGTSTDIHDSKSAQALVERSRDELEKNVEKRTEQLRRGHRFIEAVLHNVSDGVVACDQEGRITYLNPALRNMVGLEVVPDGELSSEWATAHLPVYDPDTQKLLHWNDRPLARAMRGEIVDGVEILLKPTHGNFRNIVVSVRAMTDANSNIVGAVAAWHDITDLRQSQEELRTARRNAEAANHSKSDFLANMSHELRTPITAIIGFSELQLRLDQSAAERQEYIHIVRRNAKHLLDLINDILDLSKIEAGQMTVERIDCDLPRLMAEIMSTMRPRAAEQALKFGIEFTGPIPRIIQTDALRLRQVLMNLLGNAIKFTEKGSVEISVRFVPSADSSTLHFDIKDSGIGLTEHQLGRLFQSFTQADESTTRRFGGTGLGLTISRRLARLLGGDISVKSAAGIGSVFSLSINSGKSSNLEMLEGLREVGLSQRIDPPVSSKLALNGRILLAEDGRDNQRFITTILRAAGAEVTVVENGLLALQIIASQPFDLVLMDMQMPDMDGYEATAELRRRGYVKSVIALTAHAMPEDREKCLACGCSDYISKPINIEMLMQTVARHLKEGGVTTPSANDAANEIESRDEKNTLFSTRRGYPGLTTIIDEYIRRLPQDIANLQSLVNEQDLRPLRRLVHQLKGSGGSYGFDLITDFAEKAESVIDAADDRASIVAQIDSLIDVIRRVEQFDETLPTPSTVAI